jgi:hypothetical protein
MRDMLTGVEKGCLSKQGSSNRLLLTRVMKKPSSFIYARSVKVALLIVGAKMDSPAHAYDMCRHGELALAVDTILVR